MIDTEDKPINMDGYLIDDLQNLSPKGRREAIELWNKTVNRLRKHFGLDPLPETKFE